MSNASSVSTQDAEVSDFRLQLRQNYAEGQYSGIERIDCRYSPIEHPLLVDASGPPSTEQNDLLAALLEPENAIRLAEFLETISRVIPGPSASASMTELVFKPFTGAESLELSPATRLRAMLQVSHRAHHYALTNALGPEQVKLNLMVSYIILYLTLEKGIVPFLQSQQPRKGPGQIKQEKMKVFHEKLQQVTGSEVVPKRLKEFLRYGSVLWEMVSMMGVVVLPMLALCGPGITPMAKHFGPRSNRIPVLASILSNNLAWMSLCKAWSPIAAELIFSNSVRQYSHRNLILLLITQPLTATFSRELYYAYLQKPDHTPLVQQIGTQMERPGLTAENAMGLLHHFAIPLKMFPENIYPHPQVHNVNLVDWLLTQKEDQEVKLESDIATRGIIVCTHTVLLTTFTSLLQPGHIADDVVGFLTAIWNQRGLPGWGALSPRYAKQVLDGKLGEDPLAAMTLALGGRRFDLPYEHVIMPIATMRHIFPVAASFIERTIVLYLTDDRKIKYDAGTQLLKVCFLLILRHDLD